ncbi:hypothetical protein DSECCO2_361580 [anaerobic digester metagenome]
MDRIRYDMKILNRQFQMTSKQKTTKSSSSVFVLCCAVFLTCIPANLFPSNSFLNLTFVRGALFYQAARALFTDNSTGARRDVRLLRL